LPHERSTLPGSVRGQDKPVNFSDPMYTMMLVGREQAHVRLKEVSRSPAVFEGVVEGK
jgi:hypothetical protein